jgi:hypothetical protein
VPLCNEFCGGICKKKDVAGWEQQRHDRPTYYLRTCHLGNSPITPTVLLLLHLSICRFLRVSNRCRLQSKNLITENVSRWHIIVMEHSKNANFSAEYYGASIGRLLSRKTTAIFSWTQQDLENFGYGSICKCVNYTFIRF